MSVDLEKMTKTVTEKKQDCEKLLIEIISQQREADAKKNQVIFSIFTFKILYYICNKRSNNIEKKPNLRKKNVGLLHWMLKTIWIERFLH